MAASKDNFQVRKGGVWHRADPKVRVAGSWRQVKELWVRKSGVWQKAYVYSDPKTLTFYPVWTNTYGESHFEQPEFTMTPLGSSLYQGDWDSVGHSSGMERVFGVMRFDHDAIIAAFAGRSVVSSVTLRLSNRISYTSSGIKPSVWSSGFAFTNTKPTDLGTSVNLALANQTIGPRLTEGSTASFALPTAVGDGFLDGSVKGIVAWHSGTTETDKVDFRGAWYDQTNTNSIKPALTITADY